MTTAIQNNASTTTVRPLIVGDRVRVLSLSRLQHTGDVAPSKRDMVGKVCTISHASGDEFAVYTPDEMDYWFFDRENLELVEAEAAPAFKVGDLVKIVGPSGMRADDDRDIGTVGQIFSGPDLDGDYSVDEVEGQPTLCRRFFKPSSLEQITDTAPATVTTPATPQTYAVGDRVLITGHGDQSCWNRDGEMHATIGRVGIVQARIGDTSYEVSSGDGRPWRDGQSGPDDNWAYKAENLAPAPAEVAPTTTPEIVEFGDREYAQAVSEDGVITLTPYARRQPKQGEVWTFEGREEDADTQMLIKTNGYDNVEWVSALTGYTWTSEFDNRRDLVFVAENIKAAAAQGLL